jgi:hypothetical protein
MRGRIVPETETEVSVTVQIPVETLQAMAADDLDTRVTALVNLLVAKGILTEAELAEALRKLKP